MRGLGGLAPEHATPRVSKINSPVLSPPLASRGLCASGLWNPGELLCSQDSWFFLFFSALGFLSGFWSLAFDEAACG